jgi:hypothetical protein
MNIHSDNNTTKSEYRYWFFPGAQRVGTHFQINIMRDTLLQKNISFVQHPGNTLDASDLEKFKVNLNKLADGPERYILVNFHWRTRPERDFLLSYSNALYFLIWRDFRDALVSYYYFLMKRRQRVFHDFAHFYWTEGYAFLLRQSLHQRTWFEIGNHPRVFHVEFARLVTNFEEEAGRMLAFAGLTNVDLQALFDGVSIEKRRISDGDQHGDFYRKGKIGEYWDVVQDEKIRRHVEQTLRWGQVGNPFLRRIYSSYLSWLCQRHANL